MTPTVRCLIVDDEPLSREVISSLVSHDPELEIVGESGDGEDAVGAIASLAPDLLFLDIRMPEWSGFQVLEALRDKNLKPPVTIFVTAYDEYALRAFEARALDYLLKPIDERRFRSAVAAAKSRIAADCGWHTARQLADLVARNSLQRRQGGRIPVRLGGRIRFVALEEVEWVEAYGNYIRLHAGGEVHALRESMSAFEARFTPSQFVRIHRSAMVNGDHISEVQPWFTGEYIVRLKSGKELTLTRSYLKNLPRLLEQGA